MYEPAELHQQNRHALSHFIDQLICQQNRTNDFVVEGEKLVSKSSGKVYPVKDNVVDVRGEQTSNDEWERLNEQFLNYHRSLSPFTLINATPVINYVSVKSGIGQLKNARVLDVGAGTGHMFCSFFRFPETIDYYLLDPNLRLLHDQFIRVYPGLTELKISHFLGYSEDLPFVDQNFDLVMSYSSIDHFKDFPQFIESAKRVLKPGGTLLISSHLDKEGKGKNFSKRVSSLFSYTVLERLARSRYFRKWQVGHDDHTYHFENSQPIRKVMEEKEFTVEQDEEFDNFFFLVGRK